MISALHCRPVCDELSAGWGLAASRELGPDVRLITHCLMIPSEAEESPLIGRSVIMLWLRLPLPHFLSLRNIQTCYLTTRGRSGLKEENRPFYIFTTRLVGREGFALDWLGTTAGAHGAALFLRFFCILFLPLQQLCIAPQS